MTVLIAKQHFLPSLSWLMKAIAGSKAFEAIDLLGKDYSSIPGVQEDVSRFARIRSTPDACLRAHKGSSMVLLDEGGSLHDALPPAMALSAAGVEQTTFGMRKDWKYPTVLVCRSAAKLVFESQIIARGIFRKLESLRLLDGRKVGIIGLGAIGGEIARTLLEKGIPVMGVEVAETPPDLVPIVTSLSEMLGQCDLVLGCAGKDTLSGVPLGEIGRSMIFASCSSSNVEFASVLSYLPRETGFANVRGRIGSTECTVLNAGYPVNFDRKREWEEFGEILLTRKLVLAGTTQALALAGSPAHGIMLDPVLQSKIVDEWLSQVPDRHSLRVPPSLGPEYFRRNSEGNDILSERIPYRLHHTTPQALAHMRAHTVPYDVEIAGLPIMVMPNVWSPAYDWSSLLYIENMPELTGLNVLEVGCGTGVISVFAARAGAAEITAVDINPDAVKNTQFNFERFHVEHARAHVSDGFGQVQGKFDVICWNAPYHGNRPSDLLERGCSDEDYRSVRAFFRDAPVHLSAGGSVLFGFSESGDLALIESLISAAGFRVLRKFSDWRQDYNCMLFVLKRAEDAGSS